MLNAPLGSREYIPFLRCGLCGDLFQSIITRNKITLCRGTYKIFPYIRNKFNTANKI